MTPQIFSLATANPPNVWSQNVIADKMVDMLHLDDEQASTLRRIYQNSAIGFRHSIISDFGKHRTDWEFWGKKYPHSPPGTSKRNEIYKREAPPLAHTVALKALIDWGGKPLELWQHVQHDIFICA